MTKWQPSRGGLGDFRCACAWCVGWRSSTVTWVREARPTVEMLQYPRQSPLIMAHRGDCTLISLEGTQWPYLWKIKTYSSKMRWLAGTLWRTAGLRRGNTEELSSQRPLCFNDSIFCMFVMYGVKSDLPIGERSEAKYMDIRKDAQTHIHGVWTLKQTRCALAWRKSASSALRSHLFLKQRVETKLFNDCTLSWLIQWAAPL